MKQKVQKTDAERIANYHAARAAEVAKPVEYVFVKGCDLSDGRRMNVGKAITRDDLTKEQFEVLIAGEAIKPVSTLAD